MPTGGKPPCKSFRVAELLRAAERIRAEEIVLSVPNGRSVNTLLNATPILSDAGEVESFVFTLQDMAPLEEVGAAAGRLPGHGEP